MGCAITEKKVWDGERKIKGKEGCLSRVVGLSRSFLARKLGQSSLGRSFLVHVFLGEPTRRYCSTWLLLSFV